MARDVKDELLADPMSDQDLPADPQMGSPLGELQLQISPQMQRVAVQIVEEDFNTAKQHREQREYGQSSKGEKLDFDKWLKDLKDLYFGYRLPKSTPWKFCSNRSLMIAMAVLETLLARLLPACYNESSVRWRPAEESDIPKAESIERLMRWWENVRCEKGDFFERWVRHSLGFGRVLTETSFEVRLLDRGKTTSPQPQVGPDGSYAMDETGQPVMSTPGKEFDTFEQTLTRIIPEEDIFLMEGSTDIQLDPVIIRKQYFYRDLVEMEKRGLCVNITTPTDPLQGKTLKELLLPGGIQVPGNQLTPEEMEEIKEIRRRNIPVECICWYGLADLDGDGEAEQIRVLIDPLKHLYLGAVALKDISKRGLRPLDMTLYMPRLDEPHSLHGLGILEAVKELALEIDAIFNQMTDANTLQVLKPGFFDPGGDIDAPQLTLSPNKWTPVSNPQQSIYVPDINIPTEKLMLAAKMVLEFIERLTAASAYVMGKESEIVGGSGTATRTNAIVGAAGERHAVPGQRLRRGVARILTIDLDLLQTNLPEGLDRRVLGPKNEPIFSSPVTQESVAGDFDCFLMPDDSMGSKESERQIMQMLYQIALTNPIIATDPAKLYRVTADYFKAYGKEPELYLGPKPPMNPTMSPEEEHNLMIQGDFQQVTPTLLQNGIEHIMKHAMFPQDPLFQALDPIIQQEVMAFIQQHIQQHVQLIQQAMQVQGKPRGGAQNGNQPSGPGQPAAGGAPAAPAVGPEPGVGGLQQPLSAANSTSRVGESSTPSGG